MSTNKFQALLSFIRFLRARKKYWLLPIVIILILIGILLAVAQGSVVAPFIYPLF